MSKIVLLFVLMSGWAVAQENTLSLDECIRLAMEHYPLTKQKELLSAIGENNSKILWNNVWLPRLSLNSQATYQSEITEFSFPGLPPLVFPKDQYSAALEVRQNVFDAGVAGQQEQVEELTTKTEIQKNEVEKYKLIDRVSQVYGSILLTRENLKVLDTYKEDIKSRRARMSSSLENEMVLQSNVDVLDAEMLKTDQSIIEARDNTTVLYRMLSLLIKKEVTDSTRLPVPALKEEAGDDNVANRPELHLFDLQKNLLTEKIRLSNRVLLPKIQVFGEGVYGRPGYDFINQNFRFFGKAGISLNWNISNLYNASTEQDNLIVNRQMVDVQQEMFMLNLRSALADQSTEIVKLHDIIEKDRLIVEKRQNIRKIAGVQLENGSITSSDYITELNAEMQAVLNQRIHEIRLMMAVNNYNTTKGITHF